MHRTTVILSVIVIVLVSLGVWRYGIEPKRWAAELDRRYQKVDRGATREDVKQIMEIEDIPPTREHEDFTAWWDTERLTKAETQKIVSGLWYFDPHILVLYEFTFDSTGKIVGKHRFKYK